jgi:PPP family 3-phenylpropionic acid transporter
MTGPQGPGRGALAAYAALSAAYFAGVGLFNPYAPLWFQSLGISTLGIGVIAALQSWTRVVAPYAWGWLGDHRGRRVGLIRLAAAGALLSALGLLGVREAVPVALVTTLLFLANGGIVPLMEATLTQLLHTPTGVDASRYGRVRVWGSIGFIASVSAFGVLLETVGIAVFPGFVAAVDALLLLLALRLPQLPDEPRQDSALPSVWPILRQPAVAWFFLSVFFTVLAHSSLYAFFSLYLVHLGFGKTAVGVLWAVSVAVEIVFFWFQGRWFARLSPQRWLQLVALVTAARFAVLAALGWLVGIGVASGTGLAAGLLLVLTQATHAITFAAHHSACIQLVQRYFPQRLRGRGQALYTTLGYGLSGVLGGLGGGWLVQRDGFAAVFAAAAAAGAAAWLCARRAAGHATG